MITEEHLVDWMMRARATMGERAECTAEEAEAEIRASFVSTAREDVEFKALMLAFANAAAAHGWDEGYAAAVGGASDNPFSGAIAPVRV